VSPRVIGLLMIIITIVVPLGIIPSRLMQWTFTTGSDSWIVYSLLWAFDTQFFYMPFNIMTYTILYLTLPLVIFNILYIRQIVRYYYGKTTRDAAIMVGIISLLLPALIGLSTSGYYFPSGEYLYVGPVPIQFIAGLIILYKLEGPEVISPWSGQFIDWSWWARQKTKYSNRAVDIIEMLAEEDGEDLDGLESD
jgi:hypothetical protein